MRNLLILIILFTMSSCKKDNIVSSEPPTNKDFKRAELFNKNNITDSAFYYFNLSKNSFLEKNDSIGAARALVNMAFIQNAKGDFFGSIETSLESNKFLKNENNTIAKKILTSNYNNIANASNSLKSFDSALVYYKKAIRYADNYEAKYICYNNIGDVLISKGNLKLAKSYLQQATHAHNIDNYSRALNNFAKAKYLDDKNYDPIPELDKALEIRKKINDGPGLNSSFETLSTYYLNKDKNLSLKFAQKMLTEATNNHSPDDQILALQRIITLDPKNYLRSFEHLSSISDTLQISRNRHKNQFAMVRYDVEQKNADNLKLKSKSFRQNIALIALGLTLIGGSFYYIKRKKRLEQEKELEVKNTQLKMSKKVHDVVANGIYQVMTKIENQEHFNKDETLDELEFVYEKSRDISYEKTDTQGEEKDFSERISETVSSFKNDEVNTYLAGNDSETWKHLSSKNREEVYQIIRELLVNMKKHSRATIVSFRFERENELIRIFYTDNGIGISGDVIYKNGLSSTVSRIETIHGEIIFDTKTEKGLKITISFPAS
ncbi:LPXTG cell wall anchor domain-containing protein [Chryseobacterium camelliae]|uniref:histidine kinase n=1 Tax=Chryseobacterium camelliae TaxID=1265445 RepID=A0ABY7QHU4_9FLAO|nr:LPXTG cell wall anchor domain-containing protein [Chryseobacterium camelliae]WBV59205.1 LPXTG cell wall anchor domain-containing protein [Chryseobacterium camelliae]